jgi:hypothetical protein
MLAHGVLLLFAEFTLGLWSRDALSVDEHYVPQQVNLVMVAILVVVNVIGMWRFVVMVNMVVPTETNKKSLMA